MYTLPWVWHVYLIPIWGCFYLPLLPLKQLIIRQYHCNFGLFCQCYPQAKMSMNASNISPHPLFGVGTFLRNYQLKIWNYIILPYSLYTYVLHRCVLKIMISTFQITYGNLKRSLLRTMILVLNFTEILIWLWICLRETVIPFTMVIQWSIHLNVKDSYLIAFFLVIEYCLVAILSHSTIKSHCQILLKTNLLSLLLRVAESFPNNIRLKSLIGKIIANMCLFQENHTQLAASGWIGVLAKWSRDKNILINLPALKALANLDQKFADCSYGPGIYLMLPNDR